MADRKGVVLVFTGNGKGKTTSAVGLGLRAMGHGRRVHMIQFLKSPRDIYGEVLALRSFPKFTVIQSGKPGFVNPEAPDPADVEKAKEGMALAKEAMTGGECDLLILDEINVAVDYGLLSEDEVLDLLELRPDTIDVVLTGRGATQAIQDKAHIVSEIKEVKHYYQEGIPAQKGIEY